MDILALRKRLGVVLALCGLVVILSFAMAGYLYVKRNPRPAPAAKAVPSGPHTTQELITRAQDDLKNHRVEQALVNFREAQALNPQSLPAQLGVAEGEYLAGRERVAAREYERTLKLDAHNTTALLNLARIDSHQAATWPQSEARYREYLQLNPGDAPAALDLARVLAWQGKAGEAVGFYQRAEVARLMTIPDQRDYAFALIKLERREDAEPVLKRLLASRPADTALSLQLADIYAARQEWSSALPIYRSLLRRRPDDPHLNLSYGLGMLATKNYQAALGPLAKARAAMPNSGEAGIAYARAVKGTGNLRKAVKEYDRAMPHFANNAAVIREYADVLLEKRDYKKSAKYYGRAYELGLRDNRLLAGYVGALNGAGKYKQALPYLEELHRREPSPRVTFELAKLLHRLGQDDRARELLDQVVTVPTTH